VCAVLLVLSVMVVLRPDGRLLGSALVVGFLFFLSLCLLELRCRKWSITLHDGHLILRGGFRKKIKLGDQPVQCGVKEIGGGNAMLLVEDGHGGIVNPYIIDCTLVIRELANSLRDQSNGTR